MENKIFEFDRIAYWKFKQKYLIILTVLGIIVLNLYVFRSTNGLPFLYEMFLDKFIDTKLLSFIIINLFGLAFIFAFSFSKIPFGVSSNQLEIFDEYFIKDKMKSRKIYYSEINKIQVKNTNNNRLKKIKLNIGKRFLLIEFYKNLDGFLEILKQKTNIKTEERGRLWDPQQYGFFIFLFIYLLMDLIEHFGFEIIPGEKKVNNFFMPFYFIFLGIFYLIYTYFFNSYKSSDKKTDYLWSIIIILVGLLLSWGIFTY